MAAVEESDAGIVGNPMLQVGGEQEAVTDPAPGEGVESTQDSRQVPLAFNTAGWDADQVRGILPRTTSPLVLGNELFPMMSVMVAKAV